MSESQIEHLSRHFEYESWRGRTTLGENLFVWKFTLFGDEFPGWRPYRIQSLQTPGGPRSLLSIWQPSEDKANTLFSVDTFECASRADAQELLLRTAGEFQSPLLRREPQSAVGDVLFTVPGNTSALYARANLVVLLRNAGQETIPVADFARRFDQDLTRRPESETATGHPIIRRFQAANEVVRTGTSVPLDVEASDPRNRPVYYKFFSGLGEVTEHDGRLRYQSQSAGSETITLFVVNANREVARQALHLEIQ